MRKPHLIFALLMASACVGSGKSGRDLRLEERQREKTHELLAEAVDGFYRYLISSRFDSASKFIPPGEPREAFLRDTAKNEFRVTEFNILRVELDEDSTTRGTSHLTFKVIRAADQTLVTEEKTVRWFRKKGTHWFVRYPYVSEDPPTAPTSVHTN